MTVTAAPESTSRSQLTISLILEGTHAHIQSTFTRWSLTTVSVMWWTEPGPVSWSYLLLYLLVVDYHNVLPLWFTYWSISGIMPWLTTIKTGKFGVCWLQMNESGNKKMDPTGRIRRWNLTASLLQSSSLEIYQSQDRGNRDINNQWKKNMTVRPSRFFLREGNTTTFFGPFFQEHWYKQSICVKLDKHITEVPYAWLWGHLIQGRVWWLKCHWPHLA